MSVASSQLLRKPRRLFPRLSGLLAALVASAAVAGYATSAQATTIDATDAGWYTSTGTHNEGITNYIVGNTDLTGLTYRNWFVFDLTGITDPIVAADLKLFNPASGYYSSDATETYELFDVTTDIATLRAGGFGLTGIYNDLGDGDVLATLVADSSLNNTIVSISFNAAGLAYLNSHLGQQVAIGGALTSLDANQWTGELLFRQQGPETYVYQLEVTTQAAVPTPEPATAAMGVLAAAGLLTAAPRRR